MLDFADLLTVVADGVKRKPNKKPDQQPLPSERAIDEVMGGAEQALNATPATYESKSAAEMGSPFLNEPQQSATAQGVADEPANVDNIETTPPNMGMQVYPRPQIDVPPAPQDMPVAPKAERRKLSIDEQIAQAEDEVRSATDAPIKKQSFWKDFGAKLIQGADVFFNGTKAPIVGWGRLKHDAAVDRANAKLNPLIELRKRQMADVKAKQDIQMNNLEYILKTNKGMQDMFNNDPDVLLIKQSNRVTPEQASRLNAKYGSSYTPAYWGKFVEKQVEGQTHIRPEDRANYVPNTSLPINRPESTVSVPLSGGGVGYVPSKTAVGNDKDERVAGIQANRQVAIADANNEIEVNKTNAKAINDYRKETTDFLFKRQAALTALGKDVPQNVQTYSAQLAKDEAEYDKAHNSGDLDGAVTAYNRYLKTLDSLNKAMEAAGKSDAEIKRAIDAIPMPQKPALVKQTKINLGGSTGKPKKDPLKLF